MKKTSKILIVLGSAGMAVVGFTILAIWALVRAGIIGEVGLPGYLILLTFVFFPAIVLLTVGFALSFFKSKNLLNGELGEVTLQTSSQNKYNKRGRIFILAGLTWILIILIIPDLVMLLPKPLFIGGLKPGFILVFIGVVLLIFGKVKK